MEPLTKEDVGKKIRDLRIKNSKSQEDLGVFLGKSHAAISDIERGKTELSVSDLSKIAQYFDVPMDTLLSPAATISFSAPTSSFSHHRAEYGMSEEERAKILKAREEFRKKAREESSKGK